MMSQACESHLKKVNDDLTLLSRRMYLSECEIAPLKGWVNSNL